MNGTMKTGNGLPSNFLGTPLYLKGFLQKSDHDNLLEVCQFSSQFSRVNVSRVTNSRTYANMPVLRETHNFLAKHFGEFANKDLVPLTSAYYYFDTNGLFHLRTTSKDNDLTVFIFLGNYSQKVNWRLFISDPVSESERSSLDFPAGTIQNHELANLIISRYEFNTIDPTYGDAVLFSGSRSFHYFRDASNCDVSFLCLNFKLNESKQNESQQ